MSFQKEIPNYKKSTHQGKFKSNLFLLERKDGGNLPKIN